MPFGKLITSTKMTRFFISKEDAINLCLLSSESMIGGEIFVLCMGSANILEIAKLASKSNNPKIKEIGLKAGEKLYEELVTELEAKRTIKFDNYFIRIDILERLFMLIIKSSAEEPKEIKLTSEMLNLLGCSKDNFKKLIKLMNYKVIIKDEDIFFRYFPKKRNKKIFKKKDKAENPFKILKNLNLR